MNVTRTRAYNKRKIFWIFILVAVLVYAFGETYLENWLGIDLPSIRSANLDVQETAEVEVPDRQRKAGQRQPRISSRSGQRDDAADSSSDGFDLNRFQPFLKPTGKKERVRSPAGLVYGMGPGGVHRVEHVLRHARDDPKRELHSVFDGSEQEILARLDQAYQLIQSQSGRVQTEPDGKLPFRVCYTVDMQQRIGYLGGQLGRRQNYPSRNRIALILDNHKFVVSAYPER